MQRGVDVDLEAVVANFVWQKNIKKYKERILLKTMMRKNV